MVTQLVEQVFLLATTAALCSTLAALAYRLRCPRPRWRRLAGQPGTAATLSAVAAWMTALPWVALRVAQSPEAADELFGMSLGLNAALAGFGVASWWGLLLLSRRWRGEPSWVDRLGRLLGIG